MEDCRVGERREVQCERLIGKKNKAWELAIQSIGITSLRRALKMEKTAFALLCPYWINFEGRGKKERKKPPSNSAGSLLENVNANLNLIQALKIKGHSITITAESPQILLLPWGSFPFLLKKKIKNKNQVRTPVSRLTFLFENYSYFLLSLRELAGKPDSLTSHNF